VNGQKHNHLIGLYLGEAVYGALDGTVTTFAVMAGAVGAGLSREVIIILGLANLFADGFSMAVGSFLSQRSHKLYLVKQKEEISQEIFTDKAEATQELRDIYHQKGFTGKDLTRAVNVIGQHRKTWLNELLTAEGSQEDHINPLIASVVTFSAFIIIGTMPITPLLILPQVNFWHTLIFVSIVLFLVGSLRSLFTAVTWIRGGLEIMVAGVLASLIAYGIGEVLSRYIH